MASLGATTFIGWHKYCGGIVNRVVLSRLLGSDVTCSNCASRRSHGSLGDNDITTDPYDASVEDKIAGLIEDGMYKYLSHF